ncbi:MAG: transposase [Lentisphaeraceae bacterium]|nr:transposase [Lentisphaeraceae bacterium]
MYGKVRSIGNQESKVAFFTAVQAGDLHKPKFAVLSPVEGFTRVEVARWAKEHIAPQSLVLSDVLDCFRVLDTIYRHRVNKMSSSGRPLANSEFKWVTLF